MQTKGYDIIHDVIATSEHCLHCRERGEGEMKIKENILAPFSAFSFSVTVSKPNDVTLSAVVLLHCLTVVHVLAKVRKEVLVLWNLLPSMATSCLIIIMGGAHQSVIKFKAIHISYSVWVVIFLQLRQQMTKRTKE